MKEYTSFDEIENVLSSLDMLAALSPLVKRRQGASYWKWVIVGVHDAMQGAIVCSIADSTGTNVLSKESSRQMLEWLEDTSKKYPGEFMADFKTLLKRAAVSLRAQDVKDIKRLHAFRNGFSHFTPKTWRIEVTGLPRIIGAALRLIEMLMEGDEVTYRVSGNRKRRMQRAIDGIRQALEISAG